MTSGASVEDGFPSSVRCGQVRGEGEVDAPPPVISGSGHGGGSSEGRRGHSRASRVRGDDEVQIAGARSGAWVGDRRRWSTDAAGKEGAGGPGEGQRARASAKRAGGDGLSAF